MSNIAQLCNAIVEQLTTLGLSTSQAMLPGLPRDEILRRTHNLPFALPESAIQLFMWSEGVGNYQLDSGLFPYYSMDKLSNSVQMFEELSRAPDFPRFHRDGKTWFPLFRDGGTSFIGIVCSNGHTDDGEVIEDDNVFGPRVAFLSLEVMFKTALDCFKSNVYYIDENGSVSVGVVEKNELGQIVRVDMSRFNEIARRHNPGLDY